MFSFTSSTEIDEKVTLDGDVMKKLTTFLVGRFLSSGGRVQEVVTAGIRCGWKN